MVLLIQKTVVINNFYDHFNRVVRENLPASQLTESTHEWLDEDADDLLALELAECEPGERVDYNEFRRRELGLSDNA